VCMYGQDLTISVTIGTCEIMENRREQGTTSITQFLGRCLTLRFLI
jgi:hypothetical protein